MEDKKYIIISLGGSLIVPEYVDTQFIKEFTTAIKNCVNDGLRFVIIAGGGRTARQYIEASREVTTVSLDDQDWVGIAVTRLNAELLRVSFGGLAHDKIIMDPDMVPQTDKPILLGAGWKPGNSSDLAAIHCAQSVGAKVVINLSNIDYAYDKDPNKYGDAKKIEQSSWADFRAILPKEWEPGLSSPFDPIAAEKAESLGLEVVIMNGKDLVNLDHYLHGEPFKGSVIK